MKATAKTKQTIDMALMAKKPKTAKKAQKKPVLAKKTAKKVISAKKAKTVNLDKVPKNYSRLFISFLIGKKSEITVATAPNDSGLTLSQINNTPNHFVTKKEATAAKNLIWSALSK